ncbi:MAG: ABC transporter ATP-binding protein [Anaerolineaceae bacterium]|jgi:ATP-binding cassette subfamily B protein|nr:ABC transporter ATP-binding protein [Anaerolineaceae bacterium]MDD4042578.1 ABC transporter ATP-binding protein [Anaerolineaceae bacterium]MDD4577747.1 ABC transporter ATP-binding protein [Anaerolineaceae bacterium]
MTQQNQPAKTFKEQIRSTWQDARDALRNTPQAFKLVWQASKRHTLINFSLIPLIAVLPAAQSWVGKMIVDRILQAIDMGADVQAGLRLVLPFVLFEFALLLFSTLLSSLKSLSTNILRSLLTKHVNTLIIDKSINLDLQYFEDPVFYDTMQNARRRADSSALAIVNAISQVAQQLITLISLVALLVGFSPWLAVVVILAAIPNFLSNSRFAGMSFRALSRRAPESRLLSYIEMLLTSNETVKEIKLFGLGEALKKRYEKLFTQFQEEDTAIARRNTLASLGWGMLSNLAYYGSYIWVIVRTITQAITLGDMTMFLSVFRQSQRAVQSLLENFSQLYENNLYLDNLLDFLKIEPALESPENGKIAPAPIESGIRFENVSFQYPGSEKYVLKNINLFIKPGESIALVGLNGAGKTTLIKLLTRLYDPTEGRITLDGTDLREFDLNSLHQRFGVIFQDFVRYQFSVRENIGFGQIEELDNQARIEMAADKGGADEVVAELPDGYDTVLGRRWNRGHELSGGQWQKIALSRAFMRKAEVLILDEPTSALDAEAEYEIFLRFRELMEGRVAVLISHRFSTVRMADRIVVLQEGRIVELGSHEDLMSRNQAYAHLFNLQAEGYR